MLPDSIEAYLGIAEAYRWRNEPLTAIEYLERALGHARYESDRVSIYEEIIVATESEVGIGKPLLPVGLDARIASADGGVECLDDLTPRHHRLYPVVKASHVADQFFH